MTVRNRWRHGSGVLVGLAAPSLLLVAGCAAPEVPAAQGFALAAPSSQDISLACEDLDRAPAARCHVEAYVAVLDDVFRPVVESRGRDFTEPRVVLDDEGATTACGRLTAPAYCPADATIVIPLAQVSALGDRAPDKALDGVLYDDEVLGYFRRGLTPEELATGGAYAAVIATVHEYAHHVQALIGAIEAHQADSEMSPTEVSRQVELEADCLTGWVAGHLAATGVHEPTLLDDWAGVTALTEIGDDFRDPSLVDGGHGTVEQRAVAWLEGHVEGALASEPYAACTQIVEWATGGVETATEEKP